MANTWSSGEETVDYGREALPPPVRRYHFGSAIFDVFRAKQFHNEVWLNPRVRSLVREARRAYLRYGNVSLQDEYDRKALIYLCRVQFPYNIITSRGNRTVPLVEWISIRFIPADGHPSSTEDLDQFCYAEKSLRHWFQKKYHATDDFFLSKVLTISRICGIPPRPADGVDIPNGLLPTSLKNTALVFLFLNHHALTEPAVRTVEYITGVFSEALLNKILTTIRALANPAFSVPPAEEHIGCPREHITLDRSVMAYQFPGYFLNAYQLIDLLHRLFREGKLTALTLSNLVPNLFAAAFRDWHHLSYKDLLLALHRVDELLNYKGLIPHSPLSGEALRALVDEHVGDGPRLRIATGDTWRQQIEASIRALDVTISDTFSQEAVYEPTF